MSTRKTSKATKKTTPKKDQAATAATLATPTDTDVAIIGMACRFPDANNPQAFWDNLIAGKNSIREIPEDRWDWRAYWGDPAVIQSMRRQVFG